MIENDDCHPQIVIIKEQIEVKNDSPTSTDDQHKERKREELLSIIVYIGLFLSTVIAMVVIAYVNNYLLVKKYERWVQALLLYIIYIPLQLLLWVITTNLSEYIVKKIHA